MYRCSQKGGLGDILVSMDSTSASGTQLEVSPEGARLEIQLALIGAYSARVHQNVVD